MQRVATLMALVLGVACSDPEPPREPPAGCCANGVASCTWEHEGDCYLYECPTAVIRVCESAAESAE